jgi:tetratricopeptide (TPR) repeat protein
MTRSSKSLSLYPAKSPKSGFANGFLDPNHFEALNLLGILCWRAGEPERGAKYSRQAARLQPNHPEPFFNLALCLGDLGDATEALGYLDRLIRLQAHEPRYFMAQAGLLEQLGRGAEAIASLERAIAMRPSGPGICKLMDLQLGLGMPEKALKTGQRAVQNGLGGPGVHLRLAQAYADQLDEESAARHTQAALDLDPGRVETYLDIGFAQQARGEFHTSESSFKRAIELDASQAIAYFGIAYSRKLTQDDLPLIAQMRELVKTSSTTSSQRTHLYYALGKGFDDLGEPATAIEFFDQANSANRELTLRHRPFDRDECRRETEWKLKHYGQELFNSVSPYAEKTHILILVMGMMRSGTTLLEQILSRHPEVGGAGEVHFWGDVDHRCTTTQDLDPAWIAAKGKEYAQMLAGMVPGKSRVVDKNPSNVMAAGLIYAALPEVRIIHMRRDPADTALSIWMTHVTQPPEFCCDRRNIIAMYREYDRLAGFWRTTLPPNRYLEIDYEGLVAEPETNIRRIVEFLGLPWSDSCLNPQASKSNVKTPSYWQVRQPFNTSSVGRWRRYEPWIPEFVRLRNECTGGD